MTREERSTIVAWCFVTARLAPDLTVQDADRLLTLSRATRAVWKDATLLPQDRDDNERRLGARAVEIIAPHNLSVTYGPNGLVLWRGADCYPVPVV